MKRIFTADKEISLVKLLCEKLAGVSALRIKIQLKKGEIRVNGAKTYCDCALHAGDTAEIFLPAKFDAIAVPIVYEDENIIIADKPPYVESEFALPEILRAQTGAICEAVHRLDTNTTGLVILSKNQDAKSALIAAFADKQVKKTYFARVFGAPAADEGRLTAYIVKNSDEGLCKVYDKPRAGAKEIVTDFKVISRGAESELELNPVTGRTHQLRAHLAHIGCPIVGDGKYGDAKKNREEGAKRQQLRAVELQFGKIGKPLEYLSYKKFVIQ